MASGRNEPTGPELEAFGSLVVAARDSGPKALGERWLQGWKPKRPTTQEQVVVDFLSQLKKQDRDALLETVKYFVDLSCFKLLCLLEEGEVGYEFELRMKDSSGSEVALINSVTDNELRAKFLSWVKSHGY